MRTTVLGGSGFLGSWTVRALLSAGHTVTAIARRPAPWRLEGADEGVVVAAEDGWAAAIAASRPDVLVSLDWAGVGGSRRDDEEQWRNLDRQRTAIDAAIASGARRVVAVGSQAEYGPRYGLTAEDAPLHPATQYGRAKVAASEQLAALCEAQGIDWVWARVFSIYGPLDNEGVLLQKVHDALIGGDSLDLSSGEQLWSYLYASDAARAMVALAEHGDARGIYNVGHPLAPRLRDSIELFARDLPHTGLLRFGALGDAAPPPASLEPSVSRLLSLDWLPEVALAEGLDATAAWLSSRALPDPFSATKTLPRRRRA